MKVNKLLIIQTAFIGDVILATSLVELSKKIYPDAKIHFLLRRGNENLLKDNPLIDEVIIWDKKKNKYKNLFKLILKVRRERYDIIYNIQRFFSSGLLLALSHAKKKIGFKNNPLSFFFDIRITHKIPFYFNDTYLHEVERNTLLLLENEDKTKAKIIREKPKLYFNKNEEDKITSITKGINDYLVIAPASVWFTKQWAKEKWIEFVSIISKDFTLFFIGAPSDFKFSEDIIGNNPNCINMCGKLSLKESALLMKKARRVFVNDSAPLHLASAVNAKTTAIYTSTIPEFGYGPLSDDGVVVQRHPRLSCVPCGLHGHNKCPVGHFKCAHDIDVREVIATIK